MNKGGDPYVIEYNVRMGDPESEVVLAQDQDRFCGADEGYRRRKAV